MSSSLFCKYTVAERLSSQFNKIWNQGRGPISLLFSELGKNSWVQWIGQKYAFNWEKKNFISNPLGILHLTRNIWSWESLTFLCFTQTDNENTSSTSLKKYSNDFRVKKKLILFLKKTFNIFSAIRNDFGHLQNL